jgi:hypothetical protein
MGFGGVGGFRTYINHHHDENLVVCHDFECDIPLVPLHRVCPYLLQMQGEIGIRKPPVNIET